MTQQHMTRSAKLKAFQHGLEFQTNQFFPDCFTHAIVNVRGCEIPRNVLHAGTIVVNCGLANFEQSSWSTHRRQEFWWTHEELLTKEDCDKFVRSFKDNCIQIWTIDCRRFNDPDNDRSMRNHIGRNPKIMKSILESGIYHAPHDRQYDGMHRFFSDKNIVIMECRSGRHRSVANAELWSNTLTRCSRHQHSVSLLHLSELDFLEKYVRRKLFGMQQTVTQSFSSTMWTSPSRNDGFDFVCQNSSCSKWHSKVMYRCACARLCAVETDTQQGYQQGKLETNLDLLCSKTAHVTVAWRQSCDHTIPRQQGNLRLTHLQCSQFAWSRNQGRVTSSHAADSVTFAQRVQEIPDHRKGCTGVVNTVFRNSNVLHLHQHVYREIGDAMVRTSRFTLLNNFLACNSYHHLVIRSWATHNCSRLRRMSSSAVTEFSVGLPLTSCQTICNLISRIDPPHVTFTRHCLSFDCGQLNCQSLVCWRSCSLFVYSIIKTYKNTGTRREKLLEIL